MGRHRTDDLGGDYPAGEPLPRKRPRNSRGKVLVPLAGAVAMAVLLGVAAFVIFTRDHDCTGGRMPLRVVAAPDIQPALNKIAGRYNKAMHTVDGKCVEVTVAKEDSARTANKVAAGKADADFWVADSSLLMESMRQTPDGEALPQVEGSIATSPVVLAVAKSAAGKLTDALKPSWISVISAANVANVDGPGKKVRVLALDPQKNSAGLAALLAAAGTAKEAGQDKALVGALKELSGQLVSDSTALLASLTVKPGSKVPVGVTSEQAIFAHNSKKPDSPVVALYPKEGTLSLDYPVTVLAKDPQTVKAATDFKRELSSEASAKTLREAGFRGVDGKAGKALAEADGFDEDTPAPLDPPDGPTVARVVQTWTRLNLGTRLLTLLDVSGTMALPVPGTGMTRMQAINKIATEGLALFPPGSEMGLWTFSTHLDGKGKDWKEVVPLGPLSEPVNGTLRKEMLVKTFAQLKAKETGDTGLNDTVKAAYTQLTKTYKQDKVNTLLILTDGAGNDDPDGGVTDSELLRFLKQTYNPKRPISILLIAFGPDAKKGKRQMEALAKATGGEAYIAENILQVRDFFLRGMERRLCTPNCDN